MASINGDSNGVGAGDVSPRNPSISTGNIEGLGIAIGTGASVQVLGDIHYAPITVTAPLRAVFAPLLEDRLRIFGGRRDAIASIGEFIQSVGGYLVVTAPAGFGKSALMASLVSSTPAAFAYHFFTTLYDADGLNEDFFLRNVIQQLAEWHGRRGELPENRADLRALYQELIEQSLDKARVLVLDGLDEVRDWSLRPYLSRHLPENMHIVTTVRDVGQDWLREYGFPPSQTQNLALRGLSRDELVEVLLSAGGAASTLAGNASAVHRLETIAAYPEDAAVGADPFLARVLAEDAARGVANFESYTTGLNAYLDGWWRDLRSVAGEQPIRDLLGTLTVTLGPISGENLQSINESLQDSWATDLFEQVLRSVRRFVLGDDRTGYALAHPRLQTYMQTRIKTQHYLSKVLSYCERWPDHHSRYALENYARHLWLIMDRSSLYRLLTPQWMTERFKSTYSNRGFADDVRLIIDAAKSDAPPEIVEVVRGALILSGLMSRTTNISGNVRYVLACLSGVEAAERDVAIIVGMAKRAAAYRGIVLALLDTGQRQDAINLVERVIDQYRKSLDGPSRKDLIADQDSQLVDQEIWALANDLASRGIINAALRLAVLSLTDYTLDSAVRVVAERAASDGKLDEYLATSTRLPAGPSRNLAYIQAGAVVDRTERELDLCAGLIAEPGDRDWFMYGTVLSCFDQPNLGYVIYLINTMKRSTLPEAAALVAAAEMGVAHSQVKVALILAHRALQSISRLPHTDDAVELLGRLACVFAECGEFEFANRTLRLCGDLAKTSGSEESKQNFDVATIQVLVLANRKSEALSLLTELPSERRNAVRLQAAKIFASAGDLSAAVGLANSEDHERREILLAIVRAAVAHGYLDRAVPVAEAIPDPASDNRRSLAFGSISDAMFAQGKVREGVQLIEREFPGDDFEADLVRRSFAVRLVEAGDEGAAEELLAEITSPRMKLSALMQIVQSCPEEPQRSVRLARVRDELSRVRRSLDHGDLAEPARLFAEEGQIDWALEVANDLNDADTRAMLLISLSEVFRSKERVDLARTAARQAIKAARASSPRLRPHALSGAARALVLVGDGEDALQLALESSMSTETLDKYAAGAFARTLGMLACAVGQRGRAKLALLAAEAGLRAIPVDSSDWKSWEQGEIAPAFAWAGDVARAVAVATSLESESHRAQALLSVMRVVTETQNAGEAAVVLSAAARIADAHSIKQEIDWIPLGWLAETLALGGDIDKAVVLAKRCGSSREFVLSKVAAQIAISGRPSDALVIARMIKTIRHRLAALQAAVEAFERNGNGSRALEVVEESFKGPPLRPMVLSRLAGIASSQDSARAKNLAYRALDECRAVRASRIACDEAEVALNLISLRGDLLVRDAVTEMLVAAHSSGDPTRILAGTMAACAFEDMDEAHHLASQVIDRVDIDAVPSYMSDVLVLLAYSGRFEQVLNRFLSDWGTPHFLERPLRHLIDAERRDMAEDIWITTLTHSIDHGSKRVLDTLLVGAPVLGLHAPEQVAQIVEAVIKVGSSWWLIDDEPRLQEP